jgi:2-methylcitrate dehydratase PrpD
MNLRYGIAVIALERKNGAEQFAENKIRDPKIMSFISRIQVEHAPKFEGEGGRFRVACRLVVRSKDEKEYEATVLYRKGSPEDPMASTELDDKFWTLTKAIGDERSERIAKFVLNIENVACISELSRVLAVDEKG